jgi:chromatin segregation and condensation protein Rec8/ScpA/Scc1 (kleisin family)
MTLLAGLELTRRRLLVLRQTRPFQDLWIYLREDVEIDEVILGDPLTRHDDEGE